MINDQFWKMIADSNDKTKDVEESVKILTESLRELDVREIFDFYAVSRTYMNQAYDSHLWAAAYLINDGCSDDGFEYFRGWLVMQGKEVFQKAIDNPDSLSEVLQEYDIEIFDLECESFLYIAVEAYEHKTGKQDFYQQYPQYVEREPLPDINFDWSEEDDNWFKKQFPRLWSLCRE